MLKKPKDFLKRAKVSKKKKKGKNSWKLKMILCLNSAGFYFNFEAAPLIVWPF